MSSTFKNPPPIEAISDISWQRIERSVFDQLDLESTPHRVVRGEPAAGWTRRRTNRRGQRRHPAGIRDWLVRYPLMTPVHFRVTLGRLP